MKCRRVVRGRRLLDRGFVWRGRRLGRAAGRRLDLVSLKEKVSLLMYPNSFFLYPTPVTIYSRHASHGPPFSLLMLARILL